MTQDGGRTRSSRSTAAAAVLSLSLKTLTSLVLAAAAWFGASAVWSLHDRVGPPAQTVNVRWAPTVSQIERQRAEADLGLIETSDRGAGQDRTRIYRLGRRSSRDIERIVSHPLVEDTSHIDRAALRVALDQPDMNPWLRRLLETDRAPAVGWSLAGCAILLLLFSVWQVRRPLARAPGAGVERVWPRTADFVTQTIDRPQPLEASDAVPARPVPWSTDGTGFPVGALQLLRCPACEAGLAASRDAVVCVACAAAYPLTDGILDLRSSTLDAHKQRQNDFFSDEAEGYERDVVNSPFYQALDARTVGRWATSLPPESLVLDIGSGTGRVAIALAQHGHRVIAMDLTAPLVAQARRKAIDAGTAHRIAFVLADAETLPVADGTLDGAVAHGVLHHLEHPETVVARAGRALRPGGFWFTLDPHRSPARWIFDAAMRWKTLWQEEAAPDGLQSAQRLSASCRAAGIEPTVGYSVFVLPHMLSALGRGGIERVLAVTDAMFGRSVFRTIAGVVYVCGRRQPAAPAPSSFPHAAVVAGLVALAAISGVWRIDPSVAARSEQYYMGDLSAMLGSAELARRDGQTMQTTNGPLESQLDDVGYMLGLQSLAVMGLKITALGLAKTHAVAFVVAAIVFAWALGARYESPAAAVLVLGALMLLGSRLSMLIYGQVSNQTTTSLFPPLILAALLIWVPRLARADAANPALAVRTAALGALVGAVDLVRHSHGLAVILTLVFVVAIVARGLRMRAAVAVALAIGYVAVTMLVPAVAKVQRDVRMERWTGWHWTYLQRPPAHHVSYTLLTAVGRYPNALGLYYEDHSVDTYITEHSPAPLNDAGRVDASRALFLNYVRAHPLEYIGTLARGAGELAPFLAYTTFMAPKYWAAWPLLVPGLEVEPRDLARYGQGQLLNVRFGYLRLRPWQWALFGFAWAAIAGAVAMTFRHPRRIRQPSNATIVAALVYLAWVAAPRALIPVQGMDFVFAFWCVAMLCATHLMLMAPRSPLATRR